MIWIPMRFAAAFLLLLQVKSTTKPVDYAAFAMMHQGDIARGKALFFDEQRLACSRCHAIDGKTARSGPDLMTIGDKFGRRDLVDSIINPSATIAVGYNTTVIKTKSGAVFDGVLKEANDEGVAIMQADGALVKIAAKDIASRRVTDISLMPEGLHLGLTPEEFAHLIEFLSSLKTPDNIASEHAGMPATIAELARPISLEPFHSPENKFQHPVWFGPIPGVKNCFAVIEHETGKIIAFQKDQSGESKSVFLETGRVLKGTRGLLGIAFHPKYESNHRFFIVKHLVENGKCATHIFEGRAADDLRHDSGQPLRLVLKMEATSEVHYGGGLQFGPDGYLYLGMGDTGPQQDPNGNGQNMTLLLGKMLRIDVDHHDEGKLYAIPKDNPFVNRSGIRPEIWAAGFREPWRFSFDPLTNELWVGDVGQDLFEEVDIVQRGKNYGWNVYEGFNPFSNRYRREGEQFTPPLFAYTRKYGVSVTGGFVYRTQPSSSFYGVYIFGDYESRRVFGLTQEHGLLRTIRQIGASPQRIVSFARDDAGELYIVGYEGTIYRMDLAHGRFE